MTAASPPPAYYKGTLVWRLGMTLLLMMDALYSTFGVVPDGKVGAALSITFAFLIAIMGLAFTVKEKP